MLLQKKDYLRRQVIVNKLSSFNLETSSLIVIGTTCHRIKENIDNEMSSQIHCRRAKVKLARTCFAGNFSIFVTTLPSQIIVHNSLTWRVCILMGSLFVTTICRRNYFRIEFSQKLWRSKFDYFPKHYLQRYVVAISLEFYFSINRLFGPQISQNYLRRHVIAINRKRIFEEYSYNFVNSY